MKDGYKKGTIKKGKVKFNGDYFCKGDTIEAPADIIDRLVKNGIVELDGASSKTAGATKQNQAAQPAPHQNSKDSAKNREDPADVNVNFNPDELIVNPADIPSKKGRNK